MMMVWLVVSTQREMWVQLSQVQVEYTTVLNVFYRILFATLLLLLKTKTHIGHGLRTIIAP